MSKSHQAQDSSARIPAGVKTAVLVLAFGLIAVLAEGSLVAPHENSRSGPTNASAAAAQSGPAPLSAEGIQMPMIAWERSAGFASAEAASAPKPAPVIDPSVPPADTVAPLREEVQPPTF